MNGKYLEGIFVDDKFDVEISKLKPGHELDILIAEKVMGLSKKEYEESDDGCPTCSYLGMYGPPKYSTEIASAWEVVEKLTSDGIWNVNKQPGEWLKILGNFHTEKYESVPHLICLSALEAVGVEV